MDEFIINEFCRALIIQASKLYTLCSKKTLEYTFFEAILKIWKAQEIIIIGTTYIKSANINKLDKIQLKNTRNIIKMYCGNLKIGESAIIYLHGIINDSNIQQYLKGLEKFF